MPGDLSNPAFMFPYHYDPKYDPGTNVSENKSLSIEQILQSTSRSECGCPMSKEQLADALAILKSKNIPKEIKNP